MTKERDNMLNKLKLLDLLAARKATLAILSLFIALLVLPILLDMFALHVLIFCFFYASAASSYNLISGFAGQLNLAHAALIAIGAYTSGLLAVNFGFAPWIGILIGGFTALLCGLGIGIISLRIKGFYYFAIATLALNNIIYLIIYNEFDITGGSGGLRSPELLSSYVFGVRTVRIVQYYVILLMLTLTIIVVYKIMRSSIGLSLIAVREDEDVAMVIGINTARQKIITFCVSSFFAGLIGGFYTHYIGIASPDLPTWGTAVVIVGSAMIGGQGTFMGPILGAFLYYIIAMFSRASLGRAHLLIFGLVFLIFMRFAPEGIWVNILKIYYRLKELK